MVKLTEQPHLSTAQTTSTQLIPFLRQSWQSCGEKRFKNDAMALQYKCTWLHVKPHRLNQSSIKCVYSFSKYAHKTMVLKANANIIKAWELSLKVLNKTLIGHLSATAGNYHPRTSVSAVQSSLQTKALYKDHCRSFKKSPCCSFLLFH